MEPMMTVEEVAALLKVAPYTVRRWLREGRLRGRKIGKAWRIFRSDYQAFVQGVDQRGE